MGLKQLSGKLEKANMIGALQRSLKTRVTLFTLVIFVLSLWALAYYASKMLRTDMVQMLGEQQFSTATLVAANIDQELKDRLTALQQIAADFDESELKSPAELQDILERRPVLPLLFNGGYFVTDAAGTATASMPVEAKRIGINYMFRNHVAAALGEGKSGFSTVDIGKVLRVPVFSLAVPVRDAQGKVIGSLVGVINLSSDNFLDKTISNPYGRTGGYLLVARQQRVIVTATDKSLVMEALPPPGASPTIDNFLAGREGSVVFHDPEGVEVLISAKNIPVAGWHVAATLPTAEAFAPILDMQQRMLLVTMLLTLIAGGLTWWMLRRQLAPIGAAAAALGARPGHDLMAAPLPVTTQDEIGQLISSFNSLLDAQRSNLKDLGETQRIAHIGSWHLDLATHQVVWSEELYKMYEFDPSLPVPPYTEHMKLFTPESWERMSSALAQTSETGVPYTLELETVRKDGSHGWLWVHGEVELDSAGQTVGFRGAAQDITERRQAQKDVLEALTRIDRLAQHVPGVVYAYHLRPDGSSHFPFASSGIQDIYGVLPEQVSNDAEAVFKVIHPDDLQRVIESIQASARTLSIWHEQYRVKLPDGRTIWVEGEASPEAAPDGGVLWHGHIRDITERKKTESLLLEQLDELQRWQQAMLGREDRIIKVKQEVNELLAQLGQPPRYTSPDQEGSAP